MPIETSSLCWHSFAVGYQIIVVITNILMKLLLPTSESEFWWPVFNFRVREVGDHLRCHSSKLNDTIILTGFILCIVSEYSLITPANAQLKNQNISPLPDLPKGCLPRNFTHTAFIFRSQDGGGRFFPNRHPATILLVVVMPEYTISMLWEWGFPRPCCWNFEFSGMWRRIDGSIFPKVSKDSSALNVTVKQSWPWRSKY